MKACRRSCTYEQVSAAPRRDTGVGKRPALVQPPARRPDHEIGALLMIFRALLVWLLMMAIETIHGILRNRFLVPVIGDVGASQIGVLVGSAIILGIAILLIGWIRPASERALLAIGALWLFLTLAFEFGLGHALGRSWDSLLADYDLTRGGLLSIGMVVLALSPWIAAHFRNANSD